MSKTSDKTTPAVPLVDAVIKALDILDCFSAQENELSLNQLCEKSGLYKSRVHRLCGTLVKAGFLARISRTHYSVGPKLMVLGKVYEKSNSLKSIAAPIMRQLAQETGESTALFAVDGAKSICMARQMGSSRLVFSINEGDTMSLLPSAAGRVLLAYMDADMASKILVRMAKANPALDIDNIQQGLEQVLERGYCIDDQESEEGITAIAAPIFDHESNVPAALVIVGPAFRFSEDRYQEHLSQLLKASAEMSRMMGES